MNLIGFLRKIGISKNLKAELRIEVESVSEDLYALLDKEVDIQIKSKSRKRSLNANAMAWALMSEIGKKVELTKDEVYEMMLQEYGTFRTFDNEILMIESKKELESTKTFHLKWLETRFNGTNVYGIIKGSSEYNTNEMSYFLEGIVKKARELEIPTEKDKVYKKAAESWKGKAA